MPMLVNEHAVHANCNQDGPLRQALLLKQERHENALPSTPCQKKVEVICLLTGHVRHLKWWLTKYLTEQMHIFNICADIGNNENAQFQLKLQDLQIHAVFITTPNVGGTGPNLSASHHAVIAQKVRVLNEKWEAFP